jgi:hypothetical protein
LYRYITASSVVNASSASPTYGLTVVGLYRLTPPDP